jgi:hypothetical protein
VKGETGLPLFAFHGIQASSSIGRVSVSKTEGWGFEALLACHYFSGATNYK